MPELEGLERDAVAAIREAGAPELQPSLFPSERLHELPAGEHERRQAIAKRPGGGRPPGAVNRRTLAFRDYVLQRCGGQHPIDGLIEAFTRPVQDLARELGCSALEAFEQQVIARKIVLRYCESEMPVAVKVDGAGIIPVLFDMSGAPPAQDAGNAVDCVDFQVLSEDGGA